MVSVFLLMNGPMSTTRRSWLVLVSMPKVAATVFDGSALVSSAATAVSRERAADLVQRLTVVSIVALDLWRLAIEQERREAACSGR